MKTELIGKSVDAPKFLAALEKEFDWFISYSLLLAEKHFEDPKTKRIYTGVVLLGDYLWDIHTIRFEEVIYERAETKRVAIPEPPRPVLEQALRELGAAYERAKEPPEQIKRRLREAGRLPR